DIPPDLRSMYTASQAALHRSFPFPHCRGFIVYGGVVWWRVSAEEWDTKKAVTFSYHYLEPPYVMGMENYWYEKMKAEYPF
ncbi:hypothetical protein DRO54_10070, partial [Candidatus Bathyarchaeota archaeon]